MCTEQGIQDDAKAPNVSFEIRRNSKKSLWRHEDYCAGSISNSASLLQLAGKPEVSYFDRGRIPIICQENVLVLEVSVDDILTVDVGDPTHDLLHEVPDATFVQCPHFISFEVVEQVSSFGELGYDVSMLAKVEVLNQI